MPITEKSWQIACGAEKFRQMIGDEPFRAFMMGLDKEIKDQEIRVMSAGKTSETAEQIGLEMRYAQGLLDGLMRVRTLPADIAEYLSLRVEEEKSG